RLRRPDRAGPPDANREARLAWRARRAAHLSPDREAGQAENARRRGPCPRWKNGPYGWISPRPLRPAGRRRESSRVRTEPRGFTSTDNPGTSALVSRGFSAPPSWTTSNAYGLQNDAS